MVLYLHLIIRYLYLFLVSVHRKYRQLKLQISITEDHLDAVPLTFRLNRHFIQGILNGSVSDWFFQSQSPAFLKLVPSGRLQKYALWCNGVPRGISRIYNGIVEAAARSGYILDEKEYSE